MALYAPLPERRPPERRPHASLHSGTAAEAQVLENIAGAAARAVSVNVVVVAAAAAQVVSVNVVAAATEAPVVAAVLVVAVVVAEGVHIVVVVVVVAQWEAGMFGMRRALVHTTDWASAGGE